MELAEQRSATTETKVGNPNWYPGMASPNPNGRPTGVKSLTAALEGIVDKQELAELVWAIATGDKPSNVSTQLEAAKYIYARIEGSPVQAIRHSSDGTLTPLIFLHPGKPTEGDDTTIIEATTTEQLDTDIDAQALGSQSDETESE